MVKKLKVLFLHFCLLASALYNPAFVSAQTSPSCQTINLVSSANTQTVGRNIIPIVSDTAALQETNYSPGTWIQAVNIVPHPAWVDPLTDINFATSGAVWVSTGLADEGDTAIDQWRLFKDGFTVPVGNTISSADVWYTADNAVSIYLNGLAVGTTGGVFGADGNQYFRSVYHSSLSPVEGDNTIKFVVANWAANFSGNLTGLLYKANITYCANAPADKNQCKDNGWQNFINPKFKNQGECVSYVEHLSSN